MHSSSSLTPKALFRFTPRDWLIYNGLIVFFRATGLWRHPMRTEGDFERMRLLDKVYWLYKTLYPMRRARRGSGLEAYFEAQAARRCELPPGFVEAREVRLSSVGDLMQHPYLAASGASLYDEVAGLIFDVDVAMANLECPIVEGTKADFVFRTDQAPPLQYDAASFAVVKGSGERRFDFMATACNHSLDFGAEGADETIGVLEREGIAWSGTNRDEADAARVTVIERSGIRVGAVAFTFGLNAHRPPDDRPNIVNRMRLNDGVAANDFAQITRMIADAREREVDFFVAHLHWGLEHEFYPVPEQVELAHHLAELGVDAIVGHHPHVVQPLELYRTRRDPARLVPIFYSLGNLTTPFSTPFMQRSAVAKVRVSVGELDGRRRVYVKDAAQVEVVQAIDDDRRVLRLRRADGRPAAGRGDPSRAG
jgi:poly-gamma-glutamate synthesis protein (capsule biosynthesis protein)